MVDDDTGLLEMLQRFLMRSGYEVLTAETAEEALAEHGYAVAVVDVTLGGEMSGDELARELLERDAALRVIVFSGYPFDATELDEAGRARFLQKPFAPSALADIIREMITP